MHKKAPTAAAQRHVHVQVRSAGLTLSGRGADVPANCAGTLQHVETLSSIHVLLHSESTTYAGASPEQITVAVIAEPGFEVLYEKHDFRRYSLPYFVVHTALDYRTAVCLHVAHIAT